MQDNLLLQRISENGGREAVQKTLQELAQSGNAQAVALFKQVFKENKIEEAVQGVLSLITEMQNLDENLKAWGIIQNLPYTLLDHPKIKKVKEEVFQGIQHIVEKEIYYNYYNDLPLAGVAPEDTEQFVMNIARFRHYIELLKRSSRETLRILDCGCNDGTLICLLAQNERYECHAYDVSGEAREATRQRAKALGVKVTVHDEFPTQEKFDSVSLFDVIEHVPDVTETVTQLMKVLNEGGCLSISSPDGVFDYGAYEAFQHTRPQDEHINLRGHVRCIPAWELAYSMQQVDGLQVAEVIVLEDRIAMVTATKFGQGHREIFIPTSAGFQIDDELMKLYESLKDQKTTVWSNALGVIGDTLILPNSFFDPTLERWDREVVVVGKNTDFTMPLRCANVKHIPSPNLLEKS